MRSNQHTKIPNPLAIEIMGSVLDRDIISTYISIEEAPILELAVFVHAVLNSSIENGRDAKGEETCN
jgi:hypothetical protein